MPRRPLVIQAYSVVMTSQGARLVNGVGAGLIAADLVLRLILRRPDGAHGRLGVRRDLAVYGSRDGGAVASPFDLVAIPELFVGQLSPPSCSRLPRTRVLESGTREPPAKHVGR